MADTIDVTLRVRDEGTPGVVAAMQTQSASLQAARAGADTLSAAHVGLERATATSIRAVRELTVGLASELQPALGGAVGQVLTFTQGASKLAGGLGIVGVGLAAAVAGFIPFIGQVKTATETLGGLNVAAKSLDLGPISAHLGDVAKDIETQNERMKTFAGLLLNIFRGVTDAIGYTTSAAEELARTRERLDKVLPFERLQSETAEYVKQQAALEGLRGVEQQRAQNRGDLPEVLRIHEQITQALSNEITAQEKSLRLDAEKKIAAATERKEGPASIAKIKNDLDQQITTLATTANAKFQALDEQKAQILRSVEADRLQIAVQTAQAYTQQAGLTADQRTQIELNVIDAERQLKVQQASLSLNKDAATAAAELEARVKASALAQEQLERNDPMAGLAAGFRQAAAEAGQMGTLMKQYALDTASSMQQAFSDGFFDVLTGNFKSLPDVATQFGQAMVRNLTNELAKLVTAPILGQLKNIFSAGLVGALTLSPGAVDAATAAAPPLSFVGGASPGSSVVIGRGGGNLISNVDAFQAYQQGGLPAVRNLAAGGTGLGEIPGVAIPTSAVATGPSLFARSLPVAGSAAALGLSAFQASQNTSGPGIAVSAGLGALSGAALGGAVASGFPALGLGSTEAGIGGAVVGAGLNAAIAAFAKSQADAQAAKARQAAEVQTATQGGAALVSAAGGAKDLVDLFNILTQYGSGTSGGSSSIAVPTTVQTPTGPKTIGQPNAAFPVASVQDLLDNPGSLQASIQAGVAPDKLAGANAATSTALQAIATGLANQFKTAEQGIRVSSTGQLGGPGGTRVTTDVPATRADVLGGPLSIESPGWANLSDNDKQLLLQDLYALNQKRDLGFLTRDPATNGIVSVTMMVPQTLPAPAALPPASGSGDGSSASGTPGTSTAELLTTGGALTLGLATSLADPTSLLNKILPSGFTGPDLAAAIKNLVTTGSLSGAAGAVTVQDLINQGEGLATVFNDAGVGTGGVGAGGGVGGAVSGLSGLYSLVQGAQTGDPVSILTSLAQIYGSLSSLFPNAFPSAITAIGGLAADAVAAIAPETATAIVQAAGGTISGATATGSELAAALAPAAGYLAAAGPLIAGLITWATTQKMSDLRDWAVIGQTATTLQTQARVALGQAAALFAALDAQHVTDPATLKQAVQLGSNALLAYYQTVQGPAGPIGVADFYKFTGQDPTPLQQQAAAVQAGIVRAIATLQQGGATAADLANLAPAAWGAPDLAGSRRGEFFTPEQANAAAGQTLALIGGPESVQPIMQQVGEGETVTGYQTVGGVPGGVAALGGFAPDRATLAGENAQLPADTTNLEFGGPLWAMLAYLLGPTDQYEVGGGNYYATLAQQGVTAPTFTPAQITASYAAMIAAAAAARQTMFLTGGGGDAAGVAGDV